MRVKFYKATTTSILALLFVFNIFSIKVSASPLRVNARAAIAIDSKTKVVLFEQNAQDVIPMASTTKIMTALVAIKYGDLDKKIEISSKAAAIRGSTVGYKKGELVPLRELIYGLMLRSGNDAAIAISEGIAGSVEEFVKLMNEYAVQIGLCSTHFESPHGLDSDNHYTTAYDLALITAKARENKLFNDIVQTKDIDKEDLGFTRDFHNINKILWQLPNATGVKTGFTGKAGKCLVTSVNIKDNDVVIVILNSNERWKETKKINDFVDKNYEFKKFFSKGEIVGELNVGKKGSKVELTAEEDIIVPVTEKNKYEAKILTPNSNTILPIKKGDKAGSVEIYENDKKIFSKALIANNNAGKESFIKRWFKFK
ncbi:D-alanyl-D-alanine carboxypeptidase [Clostridium sp. YIM B02515]|uniref:serine-type D-Ala-D-Ala carboxypeptidase n=1 Tax=Clostridium rhizosphaerae TaxID=2803861 RepID=A0ABS1TES7_9CLOT|nr:D-alanyl-D-alanine carboxypeptidase [Clostridium rhizosphaerae]